MPANKKTHCIRGHELSGDNINRDGKCKECAKIIKRDWYQRNRIKLLSDDKERYQNDSDFRDYKKECARAFREKNKEAVSLYNKQYRGKNSVAIKMAKRAWYVKYYKQNPEIKRTYILNYRLRCRNNGMGLSKDRIKKLIKLQHNRCYCCGISLKYGYHVDHTIPLALDGPHSDSNIQLLCPSCNLSKGAMHPAEFANKLGRLFI